ncbi:hypothetical protein [Peptacetobacter sp. AB800]|uniref:hypothetical protein n=1 Tax=Peptacetobacter sp. AB800 TaxID=3388428 RepID=UPI0039FCE956
MNEIIRKIKEIFLNITNKDELSECELLLISDKLNSLIKEIENLTKINEIEEIKRIIIDYCYDLEEPCNNCVISKICNRRDTFPVYRWTRDDIKEAYKLIKINEYKG